MYDRMESESEKEWSDQSSDVDVNDVVEMEDKDLEKMDESDEEEQQIQQEQQQQQQQQMETEQESQQQQQQTEQQQVEQKQELPAHTEWLEQYNLHKDLVCCIAQHGNTIATGSCDDSFTIFSLDDPSKVFRKDQFKETVALLDFSHDGKYLAVALVDGTVYIYNMDFKERVIEGSQSETSFLKWHPKGYVILAGYEDGTMWMWNGVNGEVISVFGGHESAVICGGFTFDGKFVLSGSSDQSFRVWKPQSSEQMHKFHGHLFHKDEVLCFDQHQEQPIIVTGSADKCICLLNYENGKVIGKSAELESALGTVCFIKTQQPIVCVGDQEGSVYLFNWNQMKLMEKIKLSSSPISKIQFLKDKFYVTSLQGQLQHLNKQQAPSQIYDFVLTTKGILVACENGSLYMY